MKPSKEVTVQSVNNEQVTFSDGTVAVRQRMSLNEVFGSLCCDRLLRSDEFQNIFKIESTQLDCAIALAKLLGSLTENKSYTLYHWAPSKDGYEIAQTGDLRFTNSFPPEEMDAFENNLFSVCVDVGVIAAFEVTKEGSNNREWSVPADVIHAQNPEIKQFYPCDTDIYSDGTIRIEGHGPDTEFESCHHFGTLEGKSMTGGVTNWFCKCHETLKHKV